MGFGRRAIPKIPFVVMICLVTAAGLGAQPSNPGALDSAEQKPPVMLLFNIRSAFSLSPSMVKYLQAKTAEKGEKLLENSGQEATSSPAEATIPISWTDSLTRSLPVAAPLDLRLMGKNLIVIVQILPIAVREPIVDLFVHGQIWLTTQDNTISYKTTMQTMSIPLGSKLYFYPLGADLKSGAPVAVEIRVDSPPTVK
jgi:hypothetical protein